VRLVDAIRECNKALRGHQTVDRWIAEGFYHVHLDAKQWCEDYGQPHDGHNDNVITLGELADEFFGDYDLRRPTT
jgi:hypothetical protein